MTKIVRKNRRSAEPAAYDFGKAGYLLTPQTEEKVRKMAEKICKTMPYRYPMQPGK